MVTKIERKTIAPHVSNLLPLGRHFNKPGIVVLQCQRMKIKMTNHKHYSTNELEIEKSSDLLEIDIIVLKLMQIWLKRSTSA